MTDTVLSHGSSEASSSAQFDDDEHAKMVTDCLATLIEHIQGVKHSSEQGPVPSALCSELGKAYVSFCSQLNDLIGDRSIISVSRRAELGNLVCQDLSSYVASAASASRWRGKPRGYAGDDVSIQMIYDHRPRGEDAFTRAIDSLFLGMSAAQAVRNRRRILTSRLEATYRSVAGRRPVLVTAMAAGPASEVFDAWDNLGRPGDLHAYLFDGDPAAVEALQHRSVDLSTNSAVTSPRLCAAARKVSLAHVALGRIKLDVPMQDVIYSLGLSDYLKDDLVVKLLNVAYGLLRPGGIVIVGNFHTSNPDKACLDHVIQWKLIHRSEADMHSLMAASSFGFACEEILRDATGVQMLAVGRRPVTCSL